MKRIVITGTSRGIGLELVKLLAQQGHQVLALSRNSEPVEKLRLNSVYTRNFDITNADHISEVSAYVQEHWKTVDILIHNAGMLVNKAFSETSLEDFKKVYDVNLFGVVALTKCLLPHVKKDGHILSISSMGGVQGSSKFAGLSAYSSSKGALGILSELLAEEYAVSGPSFNVLALGAVQTEMLQEAFPGYQAPVGPQEMAKYIAEFALGGQQYFNGKILPVSKTTP